VVWMARATVRESRQIARPSRLSIFAEVICTSDSQPSPLPSQAKPAKQSAGKGDLTGNSQMKWTETTVSYGAGSPEN
jgi:hypothetical protein